MLTFTVCCLHDEASFVIRWAFPLKFFLPAGSSWTSYVNTMFHPWFFNRIFTLVARLFQEMPVSIFLAEYPNFDSTIYLLQLDGFLRLAHFMLFFWALNFFHQTTWMRLRIIHTLVECSNFTLIHLDYFLINYYLAFLNI